MKQSAHEIRGIVFSQSISRIVVLQAIYNKLKEKYAPQQYKKQLDVHFSSLQ